LSHHGPSRQELAAEVAALRTRCAELERRANRSGEGAVDRGDDRYRELIVQLPLAVVIYRPDGRPVADNPASRKMWNLDEAASAALMAGYNILADGQLRRAGVMEQVERAFAGEAVELPPILYDPDLYEQTRGQGYGTRWIRALFYPIFRADGSLDEVVLIQEDVTARKLAEQELRRSEARLAEAQEMARLGNLERHVKDGVTRWSAELYRIFGFDPDRAPPTLEEFARRIHADDRATFDAQMARALEQGRSLDFDFRYSMPDGTIKYIHSRAEVVRDVHGEPERMIGTAQDVTEVKRIEERLRQSRDRLDMLRQVERSVLSSRSVTEIAREAVDRVHRLVPCLRASLVVFAGDLGSASVLASWGAFQDEFGVGTEFLPETAYGQIDDLQRGETRVVRDLDAVDEVTPPLLEQLQSVGVRACMYTPLLVEGQLIGSLNVAARDPGAYDREQVQVMREVADSLAIALRQAQLHEEARQHAEELEQRVRGRTAELEAANRELESFAFSVSHDLRAPLRAIEGFSTALGEDCVDRLDAAGQDHLGRIRASARRMGAMIDALLEMSRATRGELSRAEIDLSALAASVAVEIREQTGERSVELTIEPALTARADERLLRTLLVNLLGNAWKFTVPRQPARVEVGALRDPEAPAGGRAFFVRDNGVGFDPAHVERLFVPFQRLHSQKDFAGSGIGLATVERIVRRHGGRVWAQGAVDGGATVFFTLEP
jgi:PAS domain S-box-containing protein